MAIDSGKPLVTGVALSATLSSLYAVPPTVLRTKIDAITFTNYGSANAYLTAQIVASTDTAGDEKILIDAKEIRAGESYLAPELIGQGIASGGELRAFASSASTINCTATGTIYT